MGLTEVGQILLPKAGTVLRLFEKIKAQVEQARLHGRVDLARASFAVPDYPAVPQAAHTLCRNDARCEVQLETMPIKAQLIAQEN